MLTSLGILKKWFDSCYVVDILDHCRQNLKTNIQKYGCGGDTKSGSQIWYFSAYIAKKVAIFAAVKMPAESPDCVISFLPLESDSELSHTKNIPFHMNAWWGYYRCRNWADNRVCILWDDVTNWMLASLVVFLRTCVERILHFAYLGHHRTLTNPH